MVSSTRIGSARRLVPTRRRVISTIGTDKKRGFDKRSGTGRKGGTDKIAETDKKRGIDRMNPEGSEKRVEHAGFNASGSEHTPPKWTVVSTTQNTCNEGHRTRKPNNVCTWAQQKSRQADNVPNGNEKHRA